MKQDSQMLDEFRLDDEQATNLNRRMDESKKISFDDFEAAVDFLKMDRIIADPAGGSLE